MGAALGPRPTRTDLSKSCPASPMGLLIWEAAGALFVHQLGQGPLAEAGDPLKLYHSRPDQGLDFQGMKGE